MSKFHISQVGKERLRSWHKANVNKIANDPLIKEKYSEKIDNLRERLSCPSTNISLNPEPIYRPPVEEILQNISKDDVLIQKKKKKVSTSLDSLESDSKKELPHPTTYYKNPLNEGAKTSSIHVITFNKAFERDNF